ncbi:hypothetical protein HX096_06645 [Empedobacter falsenii]|uniref:hypothetical protein n=1 Tax=Empedobacter falsenii TaxID=343874 RepID=UPI002575DDB7|nr:hypothetical protein [Empedobacter falsenii]MDM1547540.1 hypothetical protein [Empedobacter falsenii]
MKKKLLLLNESGLNDIFTHAFINEGYEVISILEEPFIYKKNIFTKLKNIYHRLFLNNNSFYGNDYYKKLNKEVFRRLNKINSDIDYALIFRADYYSEKNIKLIRNKSNLLISYQYDGWELGKGIVKLKDYFDKVFFFEKDDLLKFGNKALPLTNCYFLNDDTETSIDFDIFYLGTGTRTRIKNIKDLYKRLGDKYTIKAILTIPQYQNEENFGGIKLSHKGLKYSDNTKILKTSKCLIDIKFDYHNGLSFRFFEALYYKKKLITNNESVKKYDFYNANNIFITDFENLEGIEEFLEKPYIEIDEKIVEKYGFKNWSNYVLDLSPYNKIELP